MSEENLDTQEITNEEAVASTDFGSMSDDEFLAMDFDSFSDEDETSEEEEEQPNETESVEEEEHEEGAEEETSDEPDTDSEEEIDEDPEEEPTDAAKIVEELFSPFKANGREMKVENVEEARRLMQMGANYAKKMTALKPHLKVVKMLEKQGLLDEGKLSYLIDIDKKNPEAIVKLIKESGIDPLEIDVEKASEYKPKSYTVGDAEVELDQVMSELRDSPAYQTTVDILGNKWDDSSKAAIVKEPNLMRIINEHVEVGIYDLVANEMERQRVLGKLNGLSDIDAYNKVGEEMHRRGDFNKLAPTSKKAPEKPKVEIANKPDQSKLQARKKAAGVTKSKPVTSKLPDDFNPLALSDEEFDKLDISKFL